MSKAYLSPSDKERIEKELKDIRARRQSTDDIPEGGARYYKPREFAIDDSHLAAREAQLKGIIARDSAPRVDASKKNAAYREFQTLVKEYESSALTKHEQGLGYPSVMAKMGPESELAFERSKNKIMQWEMADRGQAICHRLKELAAVIDPDNPELRNLENFRRRK